MKKLSPYSPARSSSAQLGRLAPDGHDLEDGDVALAGGQRQEVVRQAEPLAARLAREEERADLRLAVAGIEDDQIVAVAVAGK